MSQRLEQKVAAITGAASGFGCAAAKRFVAEGAKVVLGDIQEDAGRALAAELGSKAIFVSCNVTREEDVQNLIDTAVSQFGRLDIMYNNAGIVGSAGPIATTPADEWKFTIDVLLNGVFYGCKHAARVMSEQGSGSIINMASTAGLMGGLGPHAYAASKHAVIGLTKNTAAELCSVGVRVNAIAPAGMATAMVAALSGDATAIEETKERLAKTSPLKNRAGVADDVANAALWLASDESGYTTGHTLTTDAGLTTGASLNPSPFQEYQPLIREAGNRGLESQD
ncbi:MAG: glucose 1-dehydrogenase [Gammaproteobacteria bacterium]|jgi:xanthoxin dehydrogenase|nr:glucose 1-dehydrogenase [Gammaproteobacteria bacterium]MBT5204375.1 glucose 1-dehydrogenase [Gammaproteobacteria bacterium]MBT5602244.1 glucose 1-dehydrogenase [Gammaproteobacteria bacterium]MBT6244059.1 glucose 1-dehydrogenase [Gammaproteobacteria bacterium]